MFAELIEQIKAVPEYFLALKGALAVLASGLPVYAGLWYFLKRRNLRAHWGFTINFVGVIVLLAGLDFLEASPLATLLHPAILTTYLFITCTVTAFSIVALIDLFLLEHYLTNVKKIYISPPLRTVIKIFIFCLAILPILHLVLHFNPLTLVAIPTIATAGLALALQDTLKTFIAGVGLGKIIRLGDWIGFQNKDGQVVDINWARTVLKTADGNYVFIPNSQLQTGIFMNYSTVSPVSRISLKVGASNEVSPVRVKQILMQCMEGVPGLASAPTPVASIQEYGDSAILYGAYCWVEDFTKMMAVQDEISTRIWYAFRREGIEIPSPVRTVYLRRSSKTAPKSQDQIAKALEHWALADAFYAEELTELAQFSTPRSYAAGETIVHQGDVSQSLFVIVEGSVCVYKKDRPAAALATLQARDVFGEMSLLTGEPRSATVRAQSPVEVLEIQKAGFQKVIARRPELSDKLAQLVVQRQATAATGSSTPDHGGLHLTEASTLSGRIRSFFGL